ncbi:MAG: SH3 domain-containing protein [Chloroflexi bacterium]|nr:SH3 domain-containing protein [Chloroflexota bacterium]
MRRWLTLILLACLLVGAAPAAMQEQQSPLVVFVLNPEIDVASTFDAGPDGISTLDGIFRSLGARTQVVNLIDSVPASADVVVLVGPRQRLSILSLVRLWLHLARGNDLLLALDPVGYAGNNSDRWGSGLINLLNDAYGITVIDAFMAEPWFTKDLIAVLSATFLDAYADVVPHPVVEPLIRYQLSVEVWSARPVRIEPVGVDSYAVPLLQTSSAFGETDTSVFTFAADSAPLELNLEGDVSGRVNIAGLAENTYAGSRIAVLGDSEMLRNGYGLAKIPGSVFPSHPGNQIFVERLAAWLLGLPEDQWPALPPAYTWIALDGSGDDWDAAVPVANDGADVDQPALDLQQARAFKNDAFVYLMVETAEASDARVRLEVDFQHPDDRVVTISATSDGVVVNTDEGEVAIPDAQVAVSDGVELRLPLRVVGEATTISRLCLYADAAATTGTDCFEQNPTISATDKLDPVDLRFPPGPTVRVSSIRNANLRQEPAQTAPLVGVLTAGQTLRATGRTEAGDWIRVESGAYQGWVFATLIIANHDTSLLPVIDGPG